MSHTTIKFRPKHMNQAIKLTRNAIDDDKHGMNQAMSMKDGKTRDSLLRNYESSITLNKKLLKKFKQTLRDYERRDK